MQPQYQQPDVWAASSNSLLPSAGMQPQYQQHDLWGTSEPHATHQPSVPCYPLWPADPSAQAAEQSWMTSEENYFGGGAYYYCLVPASTWAPLPQDLQPGIQAVQPVSDRFPHHAQSPLQLPASSEPAQRRCR